MKHSIIPLDFYTKYKKIFKIESETLCSPFRICNLEDIGVQDPFPWEERSIDVESRLPSKIKDED